MQDEIFAEMLGAHVYSDLEENKHFEYRNCSMIVENPSWDYEKTLEGKNSLKNL